MKYVNITFVKCITKKLWLTAPTAFLMLLFTSQAFCQTHTVLLTWTPSNTSGVSGYDVLRGLIPTGPFVEYATGIVGTGYTDIAPVTGVSYYTVQAVLVGVASVNSNVVMVTVPAPQGAAPVPVATTLVTGTVGSAYPPTTLTTSCANVPCTWSYAPAVAGLTLSSTGVLTGTPTTAGSFTPVFTVTDSTGLTGTETLPITINAQPPTATVVCNAVAGGGRSVSCTVVITIH